jgi:hypothetical protein
MGSCFDANIQNRHFTFTCRSPFFTMATKDGFAPGLTNGLREGGISYDTHDQSPTATPYYMNHSDRPPIPTAFVQGDGVYNAQSFETSPRTTNNMDLRESLQPKKERRKFKDVFWTLLFCLHLGAIACLTAVYTPTLVADLVVNGHHRLLQNDRLLSYNNIGNAYQVFYVDPQAIVAILIIASGLSLIVSTLALGYMMKFPQTLVKIALFFNIAVLAVMAFGSFCAGFVGVGIILMLYTIVAALWFCCVRDKIPFAASNLRTAVSAVRSNFGLSFYAYSSVLVIFLWTVWWTICFTSTIYVTIGCDKYGNCQSGINKGCVSLFLLSYYWTTQVIANVVHCTTAGAVGTWWFIPEEAKSCCSKGVRDSYFRSISYSFGSICLASLFLAILQAHRKSLDSISETEGLLGCCIDCILMFIEFLLNTFNRFVLVYCAVHGQNFCTAGDSVMSLFIFRGWTTIFADALVDTVLLIVSLGVALMIGVTALFIGLAMGTQDTGPLITAFALGFIIGYATCATLLSIVSSAVNTVIVLYAEAPNEFQHNHPELSAHMCMAWRQAWPIEFNYRY